MPVPWKYGTVSEERQRFLELSQRPHTRPWQTDKAIVKELVELRKTHPCWEPRKLLDLMHRRAPERRLPFGSNGSSDPGKREAGEAAIDGLTPGQISRRILTIFWRRTISV